MLIERNKMFADHISTSNENGRLVLWTGNVPIASMYERENKEDQWDNSKNVHVLEIPRGMGTACCDLAQAVFAYHRAMDQLPLI